MSLARAFVAATRFGLGVVPGELESIAVDPERWLSRQLSRGQEGPSGQDATALVAHAAELRGHKERLRSWARGVLHEESQTSLDFAVTTTRPFRERLVRFYGNVLTVSFARKEVTPLVGAYEREAIRPHVTGRYEDLLLAAVRHPAMVLYLDNQRSTGPDSPAGRRKEVGLNENLAREILELHTLGSHGGYDQDDVEALAALLTGWTVSPDTGFAFDERRHQPGRKRLLGRSFGEGEQAGIDALRMLARHPSTAANVCTRLAEHFLADEPDPDSLRALTDAWGDGDLKAAALALLELESAWRPLTRVRTPLELVIAAGRALPDASRSLLSHSATSLGQTLWQAPSPQGWSERSQDWIGPDAVLARVQWCQRAAARAPVRDAELWARSLFGPLLSDELAATLRELDDPAGMAVVLASPQFQRR